MVWSRCCHRKGGSQQKRSPRRGTGSTGFRDCPPAAVAVASRERMRLCRRASASAREPLLSEARSNARPAPSVSRAPAPAPAVARDNNPRVDRACVLRDRRCESWSLGGARRLLSLISSVGVPFDRGLNVKKRLVFGLPHLHATDMLLE